MRRYSQEERRAIVKAFKSSGMTQRGFARTSGVNFHTLQHWLHYKPKRSKPKTAKVRFVEVNPTATDRSAIRLRVAADLELSLSELPPPAYLVELSRTLASSC